MPFKNKEDAKKNSQRYYLENREKKIQQAKDYYFSHLEKKAIQRKKWAKNNQEKVRASARKYYLKYKTLNQEKVKAHRAVRKAIRNGLLIRPNICEECNKICKTQAHHNINYNIENYLKVIWLCAKCHKQKQYDN